MCRLVEGPPSYELRKGIVYIVDQTETGPVTRAMLLGDFVAASRRANQLARKWVAEANVVGLRRHS